MANNETFYGNNNETFYIDQFGRVWLVQSVDWAGLGDKQAELQTALPVGVDELSDSVCLDVELPSNVFNMPETAQAEITKSAKADAQLFVDEFNEPLNPAATDWDYEAFATERGEWTFHLNDSQTYEAAWELYQKELVAETERLSE